MSAPTPPVMEMALHVKDEALAPVAEGSAQMFERLARDPSVDVDKLERLMQMHERATARFAQEQFNAAMSTAQQEMRPISADAENPQTRSKYASYGKLDVALRPIYTKHGFGLSFDTGDSPLGEHVRVICHVSHRGGHSRPYHVDMPADGKGARGGDVMTKTHAVGSALSYGMRYLLKMIFNVAVGEQDDDGNGASRTAKPAPAPPEGYLAWLDDMSDAADAGMKVLEQAWKASKNTHRGYLQAHEAYRLGEWKATARKVQP